MPSTNGNTERFFGAAAIGAPADAAGAGPATGTLGAAGCTIGCEMGREIGCEIGCDTCAGGGTGGALATGGCSTGACGGATGGGGVMPAGGTRSVEVGAIAGGICKSEEVVFPVRPVADS